MTCGGAAEEPATIDRLCPLILAEVAGLGLRLPTLDGAVLVDDDGRSSGVRALTMLTSGGTAGAAMPAVLPRLCSMRACCCCFRLIMDLTCSSSFGSSPRIVKPITTGDMPLSTEGRLTSVFMPLIVTRRFLEGLGEVEEDGEASVSSLSCLWCTPWPTEGGEGIDSFSVSCLTLTTGRGDRRLECANRCMSP